MAIGIDGGHLDFLSLTQFKGSPFEVEVKAFETTEVTLVVPDE